MARTYIPKAVRERVHQDARNRCGYCLSPKKYMPNLEIDHIIPVVRGGTNEEANLWLACHICNGHKASKVSAIDPLTGKEALLFNPRTQNWYEHFRWSDDALRVIGLTPTGRATVIALHLDSDPDAITMRENWVEVGWYPPLEE
jgi:hypothetical protein